MLTHDDGRLRFANPAAERLLGPEARTFLGQPLTEVLGLRAAGSDLNFTGWLAEVRRGAVPLTLPADAALELPNGAELPVEGSAASLRHLQTAREEERTVIARELHDELGQLLTGFKIDLVWLEKRLKEDADSARSSPLLGKVKSMLELVQGMVTSVRRISAELRPPVLDDGGLPAALEWLTKDFHRRSGVACQLDVGIERTELPREMATALFRIVQESLTNVMRHAAARRVQVELWDEGDDLHLRVQDDGRGVCDDERQGERSFGLLGMRERALLLGGEFQINRRPEGGTTVCVRVPLNAPDPVRKNEHDSSACCR
jgi:signal transduction histidine kinase